MLYREKHYDLKAEAFKEIRQKFFEIEKFIDTKFVRRSSMITIVDINTLKNLLNNFLTVIYTNEAVLSEEVKKTLRIVGTEYREFMSTLSKDYTEAKRHHKEAKEKFQEFVDKMKRELGIESK